MVTRTHYVFRRTLVRALARVFDGIGSFFFRRSHPFPKGAKTFLVIRLDQIGDVSLAETFIRALKRSHPDGKILLLTTPQGKQLYRNHTDISDIVTFQPPWFVNRTPLIGTLRAWIALIKCIRANSVEVIIDLRGDVRHISAARLAQPKAWLISYGITGGGFLLDGETPYDPSQHAVQKNVAHVTHLNLKRDDPLPLLPSMLGTDPLEQHITHKLPPRKHHHKWIALHVGTRAPARAWPHHHWQTLIQRLLKSPDTYLFWIGDRTTQIAVSKISSHLPESSANRFTNLCDILPIGQLGTFLKKCDLLVSVDSGPVHIAAAHEVKTLILFSGTTDPRIWKPQSQEATLIHHPVPCSPCHERSCPLKTHDCMEGISPQQVFDKIRFITKESSDGSKPTM